MTFFSGTSYCAAAVQNVVSQISRAYYVDMTNIIPPYSSDPTSHIIDISSYLFLWSILIAL